MKAGRNMLYTFSTSDKVETGLKLDALDFL